MHLHKCSLITHWLSSEDYFSFYRLKLACEGNACEASSSLSSNSISVGKLTVNNEQHMEEEVFAGYLLATPETLKILSLAP